MDILHYIVIAKHDVHSTDISIAIAVTSSVGKYNLDPLSP